MNKERLTQKVIAFAEGDNDAFSDIYEMTKNNFFAYALFLAEDQNSAEEILQDAYMNIIQSIGNLHNPEAFTTWGKKILYNIAMQKFRRGKKEIVCATDEGELFNELEERDAAFLPGEEFDREEVRQIIIRIVNGLSAEQKMTILSFYYDEMTVKEIAEVMACSEGTVKSRLFNGRKAIKEGIEAYEREHDVRLHAAVPAGLLFAVLKDLDQICKVPGSVSRKILKSSAGVNSAQAGTAANTAKAAWLSGMGMGKVVSLILVATLAIGGVSYGVKQIASRSDDVPAKADTTEEDSDKQKILDAYSAYFTEKVKDLREVEEEGFFDMKCRPCGRFIDEDNDKIPEAIIFYSLYRASNYTICTYVDGKVAELHEEDFVPSELYYGIEARISPDKREIILMIGNDENTSVYAGRFQLDGERYELIEKDVYDKMSGDDEKVLEEIENKYVMKDGKSYATGNDNFYIFESVDDFVDCLSSYGIMIGSEGDETDWQAAYREYFASLAEHEYFDDRLDSYLASCDVNGDGIPEIFVDEPMYKNVFSFINGRVQAMQDPETGYSDSSARLFFDKDTGEIGYFNSTGTVGVPAMLKIFEINAKGFQVTNKITGYFHLNDEEIDTQFDGAPPYASLNWQNVELQDAKEVFEEYDVYNRELADKMVIHSKEDFYRFFEEKVGVALE